MTSVRRINKPFNFRLMASLTISLIGGILFGVILSYFDIDGIYVTVPFVLAAVPFAICTVKFKNTSLCLCFAFLIAAFLIGAVIVMIYCGVLSSTEIVSGKEYLVEGRVDKVGITSGGTTYLVISNVRADGTRLSGKIIAYLGKNAGEYCEKGYTVRFYTSLTKEAVFDGGTGSYYAQNGIEYRCTVNSGLDSTWGFSLFGWANRGLRNALFNNLDGETASVCYAMLTGDSTLISEGTITSFRNGGIAHLFAVSGLHIGVLFGSLTLLFKKLPVNRYASAAIRILVIFFYAGVCNFTPSSVRATIMCAVSLIASLAYKKNDSLNSLSLSAFILLLINPMYIFGAGFLLSFGAVLGIIMLSRNIRDLLRFLPRKLSNALSVGISAQLSTAPTQMAFFGYVSWAGLFLNVIIIPVVSILYVLLFFCTVFSAIIPQAAGVLVPFAASPIQLLINLVVELGFENAIIQCPFGMWIYIPFAMVLMALSDKFNFNPVWRSVLMSVAMVCLCVGFVLV